MIACACACVRKRTELDEQVGKLEEVGARGSRRALDAVNLTRADENKNKRRFPNKHTESHGGRMNTRTRARTRARTRTHTNLHAHIGERTRQHLCAPKFTHTRAPLLATNKQAVTHAITQARTQPRKHARADTPAPAQVHTHNDTHAHTHTSTVAH